MAVKYIFFLIDAAVQNAFALAKLTNESQTDIGRLRQTWIEKLGLDLIKQNAKIRYEIAAKEGFRGRKTKKIQNAEDFLKKVFFKRINKI
jgi:hypothetical protein